MLEIGWVDKLHGRWHRRGHGYRLGRRRGLGSGSESRSGLVVKGGVVVWILLLLLLLLLRIAGIELHRLLLLLGV